MLNNSSAEADNMQLYLGYGGCTGLLPAWIRAAQIVGITLQAEQDVSKLGHFA